MYTAMVLTALCNMIYLALHVTGSSCFPQPLSKEEEQECLRRIEQGDEEAKNELIEHNLRLVAHIIKKYYASYRDQEDLISIGTIGLIKAASTFNSSKGTKFATYASRCIENEILMYFRQKKKTMQDVSINDPIDMDKDGNSITLMDIVQSDENIVESIDLSIQSQNFTIFWKPTSSRGNKKFFPIAMACTTSDRCHSGRWQKNWIFPGAMYPALRRRRWGS